MDERNKNLIDFFLPFNQAVLDDFELTDSGLLMLSCQHWNLHISLSISITLSNKT
jgi:hypothetical protein